jgi:hypothetical protein
MWGWPAPCGAGLVVTADTIPFRLKKAEQIGADLAHAADDKLINALREVNEGRLADLVIVCFEGFIPLAVECVERAGIAVKNNRKTIDGRRDKNDTKDPAVIADLMSQGKFLFYEYPPMSLRDLRNLLSLKRRLKKQEFFDPGYLNIE